MLEIYKSCGEQAIPDTALKQPLLGPARRSGRCTSAIQRRSAFLRVAALPIASGRQWSKSQFQMTTGSTMAGYVEREFESRPYPEFVESGAQVVFNDLLAGVEDAGAIPVRKTLPDQGRDLNFFGS
jgi:hypothetical protein